MDITAIRHRTSGSTVSADTAEASSATSLIRPGMAQLSADEVSRDIAARQGDLQEAKTSRHGLSRHTRAILDRHNQEISSLQASDIYLVSLASRLKAFRGLLVDDRLNADKNKRLQDTWEQVHDVWTSRHKSTEGALSNQLRVGLPGTARIHFSISGLTFKAGNEAQRPETLNFYSGGIGAVPLALHFSEKISSREEHAGFRHGMSMLGLSMHSQPKEDPPVFSIMEKDFSTFSRTLRIKGDGMRFAAGAPQAPGLIRLGDVVDSERWQPGQERPNTEILQEVSGALGRVAQARGSIAKTSLRLSAQLALQSRNLNKDNVAMLSAEFGAMARDASMAPYKRLLIFSPAVARVDAPRVRALLSLE